MLLVVATSFYFSQTEEEAVLAHTSADTCHVLSFDDSFPNGYEAIYHDRFDLHLSDAESSEASQILVGKGYLL